MATYVYETIPSSESEKPVRFEYRQSMKEQPLSHHPESGQPVKRVITGGFGFSVAGSAPTAPTPSSSCCHTGGCGCAPH